MNNVDSVFYQKMIKVVTYSNSLYIFIENFKAPSSKCFSTLESFAMIVFVV